MRPIKVVGVVSVGEMGMGFAQLLIAHNYRVVTYAEDRSQQTRDNAQKAGVDLLQSIDTVATESDVVLSIVPPRDAYDTAERFAKALSASRRQDALYYIDLNATSPETAKRTAELFKPVRNIKLVDGGIIGGVPHPLTTDSAPADAPPNGTNGAANDTPNGTPAWHCPACIVSGPDQLPDPVLVSILHIDHVSPEIVPRVSKCASPQRQRASLVLPFRATPRHTSSAYWTTFAATSRSTSRVRMRSPRKA